MATLLNSAQSTMTGADPAVATITEPTQGNLLIAVCTERSGGDATNHALTDITGWEHTIASTIEQASGTYRRTFSIFWKEAGASEGTSLTFDDGTANSKYLTVYEYQHVGGSEDQWVLLDSASNDNGTTSNATTIASGTTGSQSGEMFIFAAASVKRPNSLVDTSPWSWDSGLSEDATFDPSVGNTMAHGGGSDAKDTATGTKSSTVTLTAHASNIGLAAGILVFDVESGAAYPLEILQAIRFKNRQPKLGM